MVYKRNKRANPQSVPYDIPSKKADSLQLSAAGNKRNTEMITMQIGAVMIEMTKPDRK